MKKTLSLILFALSLTTAAHAYNEVKYEYSLDSEAEKFKLGLASSNVCLITVSRLPCEDVAATIADKKERKEYQKECEPFTLDESTGTSHVNVTGSCDDAKINGRIYLRNYPSVIPLQQTRILGLMRAAGFGVESCQFSFKQERADYASCQFVRR